jgi:hypothetical protein
MLKITYVINDKKVKSDNIQFVMDIKSYVELAMDILENNQFQRKRVSKSGSVYKLLKEDILKGCIIPPIVLASISKVETKAIDVELLNSLLAKPEDLKILDGLQRTYSLIEVYNTNKEYFDNLDNEYLVRIEVYLSITDTGILYRMLTLNTGQTPMSLRHQLEILFSKYLGSEISGTKILKEVDDQPVNSFDEFKFSDLIDGYNSFLEKNELPIGRFEILKTVQTIEFISKDNADKESFQFPKFVDSYSLCVRVFNKRFKDWTYPKDEVPEEFKIDSNPFGKEVYKIFNKSQPITGFGSAVAQLISLDIVKDLNEVDEILNELIFVDEDLLRLNKSLDEVRQESKKIGNGQRIFFRLFFKYLLDSESGVYKNVSESLEKAQKRALAEV